MRRVLLGVAWVVGLGLAIYLVAGNLLINTPLGPRLVNQRPERLQMEWRGGLTWWPGSIALWGVEIDGRARQLAWSARAERARGRIAVWPLLRRELRMPAVHARELAVELTRAEPLPPRPPKREEGWTLRFDRIATDSLRRFRWDGLGLELHGSGEGELALVKQIRGPMEILPTRVAMREATLVGLGLELARQAQIELDLAIARHTREEAPGWRKLALTEAALVLEGDTPALAVDFDEEGRWRVEADPDAPRGRIEGRLALADGELQPGGVLRAHMPLRSVRLNGHIWNSRADLQAVVDDGLAVRLRVPSPPEGVGEVDADLHLASARLPVDGEWRDLAQQVSGTLDLSWQFDSLAWLSPLLARAPWLRLEGSGTVDAALQIVDGQLVEGSRVTVPDVVVNAEVLDNSISGSAHADARLEAGPDGLVTRTEILIERFSMAPGDDPDLDYVDGTDLRLELVSSGELAEVRETLHASIRFEDARVADLRVYNRYLPGQALRFLGGSGRLSGDLELDPAGQVGSGTLRVAGRDARLALGDLTLAGDLELEGRLARANLTGREFDLDGTTIRLSNVRAADAEGDFGAGWWARIALEQGRVHWGQPLKIESRAVASLQSVGPLLALFARHRDYPAWVMRTVDAGETRISTRALLQRGEMVLDRLEAANDRFDLNARLRFTAGPPAGDLYLRWGILGLGLELRDGKRDFRMVRPQRWYRSRPDFLPATAQR